VDPISGATVMNTVLTVLGPTENTGLPGVREWCINSAAVDIANKCAVINSEDGHVYRWSFTTNSLSEGLNLAPPTSEAYTSTLIGPDGAVYATNDANLFCCAASLNNSPTVTPGGGGGGTPPTGVPTVTPSPGNTPTPIAGTGITTTTTPSSGTTTTTTTKGPTPSTPEPAPPPGPAPKPTKPPKKPKKPKPKAKPKASAFLVIPKDSDKWAPKEDGLG
jgi:cell division septation protein DedD